MDSKYERTLSMSLLAFANFLSIFQPAEEELDEVKNEPNPNEKSDHDKEMVQFYITLLESGKFWKFANHKSSSVSFMVVSRVRAASRVKKSLQRHCTSYRGHTYLP